MNSGPEFWFSPKPQTLSLHSAPGYIVITPLNNTIFCALLFFVCVCSALLGWLGCVAAAPPGSDPDSTQSWCRKEHKVIAQSSECFVHVYRHCFQHTLLKMLAHTVSPSASPALLRAQSWLLRWSGFPGPRMGLDCPQGRVRFSETQE